MKAEYKIPFKKLSWRDNVTELGKEKGFVEWIGEIYQSEDHRHNTFMKFYVSNNYGGKLNDKFIVSCDVHNKEIEFDNLDLAKEYCQKYFESYIIKTFFEDDGRDV
jgi:hypothetical protein